MQGQIAARIQNTVVQDHNIIACGRIFIVCMYSDIALLRLSFSVYGNDTLFGIQRYVLLCHDGRVVGCVMADGNVAFSGFNIDAAAGRSYGMDFHACCAPLTHGNIAAAGFDSYIPADNHVSA